MNILKITFNSINAERKGVPKGPISVSNNINIDDVEQVKIGLDETKSSIKVAFTYKTQYSSDFAFLQIKGEVLIIEEAKEAKKMVDKWKKDKTLEAEAARKLLNNVMNKCSMETILLSRELGLPSPIPLPSIKAQPAEEKSKKKA